MIRRSRRGIVTAVHGGMGGGGGQFGGVMRSMRRDGSVTEQQITKGTASGCSNSPGPTARSWPVFLVLVIVDAVIGVVNPLLFRSIIDKGIPEHDKSLIIGLAAVAAVLALLDTGLTIGIRWVSAKVGEGLIFDMRVQVFEHIQKMPIAFFTRTQTGALISRLNNDVIGAQQAFTDTLSSVVSNLISVTLVLIVMFFLSWQITLISLIILPSSSCRPSAIGRRLSVITRESYGLNAQMNTTMNERFNVSGALLVKLFGRPEDERDAFESEGRTGPGHRGDPGHVRPILHRRPDPHRRPGHRGGLRLGRGAGGGRRPCRSGTVVALAAYLTRLYGPLTALSNVQIDIMTALVSFDRVFEVLDLPPMIDDKPDARPVPAGPGPHRVRPRRLPLPHRRGGLAGVARVGGRPRPDRLPARCCST